MKKKYHKTMSASLLLLVLIVSAFAGCSANSSQANNTTIKANQPVSNTNNQANQPEKTAATFINKVFSPALIFISGTKRKFLPSGLIIKVTASVFHGQQSGSFAR